MPQWRSAKSQPGQPFWSLPTRWVHAERMLQLAVDYSKQRQQFGRPIGSFQAVKHAAAQMLVTVESSMSIVFYAAQSVEEGLPERATHAAVAKAQVTGGSAELADSALTLHGAIGYTWEHDLQLFYKRAKLDRVLFGTPTAWNERIADGPAATARAGLTRLTTAGPDGLSFWSVH